MDRKAWSFCIKWSGEAGRRRKRLFICVVYISIEPLVNPSRWRERSQTCYQSHSAIPSSFKFHAVLMKPSPCQVIESSINDIGAFKARHPNTRIPLPMELHSQHRLFCLMYLAIRTNGHIATADAGKNVLIKGVSTHCPARRVASTAASSERDAIPLPNI